MIAQHMDYFMSSLKMLNHLISPSLSILINESFSTGIFPDQLKIAKVITLHKKESAENPSNYRPISLLSVLVTFSRKLCIRDSMTSLK